MIKSILRSNLIVAHSSIRRRIPKPENPNHRPSCKRKALVPKRYNEKKHAGIGKKWMEYQGINGWDGLLDPLDDNLRGEILRYGDFVEAAYRSFNLNHDSPNYGACKYSKKSLLRCSDIPETGYEVTRNLVATCGVELPSLAVKLPSWMLVRSSWIGYVAVCRDKQEISRLGRRDVVIAFRGTVTCLEWLENVRATLTHLDREDGPMVQSGFLSLYTSKNGRLKSLQELVREEVKRIIDLYSEDQPALSFTITGHSLGAALGILTAHDIDTAFANAPITVTVISFGGPRVGDTSFRCQMEKKSRISILRVVNSDDLVTKVPGFVINYDGNHGNVSADDQLLPRVASGMLRWLQKLVVDMRWLYAEVGQELRFSSRDCPYLGDTGIATCHDLKTYLQLVSGSKFHVRAPAKQVFRMYREK